MANLEDKKKWLEDWARSLDPDIRFVAEAECGFGRECVSITHEGLGQHVEYPDDAPVTADDAYHKGPYLCVLGRGENAVNQMYDWCKALDAEGYNKFQAQANDKFDGHPIAKILGQDKKYILVRSE